MSSTSVSFASASGSTGGLGHVAVCCNGVPSGGSGALPLTHSGTALKKSTLRRGPVPDRFWYSFDRVLFRYSFVPRTPAQRWRHAVQQFHNQKQKLTPPKIKSRVTTSKSSLTHAGRKCTALTTATLSLSPSSFLLPLLHSSSLAALFTFSLFGEPLAFHILPQPTAKKVFFVHGLVFL